MINRLVICLCVFVTSVDSLRAQKDDQSEFLACEREVRGFFGLDLSAKGRGLSGWGVELMDLLGEGASGVEIMAKLALLQEDAFYRAKIRESTSIIAVRFIFPVDSIYRTYLVLFMLDEDRRLKDVHVSQGIIATRQLAKDQEP